MGVRQHKQAGGDKDHLKIFVSHDAAEIWLQENDPEVSRSNMRSWSEPHRPAHTDRYGPDRLRRSDRASITISRLIDMQVDALQSPLWLR